MARGGAAPGGNNPIFEASSNHGYDTNDYFNVRAIFGGNAAFDQLTSAANAKGLRVILDGVFNHTGMDSVYIDKTKALNGACTSASSPQRAWFTAGSAGAGFNCDGGWGWKGWYNYATLPEFVDASPCVRDLFFRGGAAGAPGGKSVSQFWQDKGIAGWYLYQSYINQNELDSVMNYCFRDWSTGYGGVNGQGDTYDMDMY